MKRTLATILVVTFLVTAIPVLTGCKIKPKNWYKQTLDYYGEGIRTNWVNEDPSLDLNIAKDLKSYEPNKEIGYLLTDLDGDGVDELLIGFNDGSNTTKFTDLIVWHSDLGAYKLLGGGEGYYIYLCASNVIAVDSWYGSQTERTFMQWNSKTNSFPVIEGEGKYLPKKWELTSF
ncbi:MAG: hypothetical protein IKG03_01030 [Clostridiales bacterium]|nr:hypothetical protein [Clostridiales bacterium]